VAHDLRGPLSAAKISSQVLAQHPERVDERRKLAVRIDRNIDRMDRMIRDLLDANRIRAGQRLPLRIDECDLAAIAREVYEELVATFGERFVLKTEPRVIGFWSAPELGRTLWNLITNAVKYGDPDKPITIDVQRTAEGAQASVHNWGTPISADDQRQLFRPFSRTHAAQAGGQRGWGLGLTLVHGCAVAHGGRVEVESSQATGTTFTLDLPPDSRPFQAQPDETNAERATQAPTMH
jgi:signal transduction histidine kinase